MIVALPSTIRVMLPAHLRNLARVGVEVTLELTAPVTIGSVLDALEARYPVLCGTIRDHVTQKRRPFVRFFACSEDLSHESPDAPLPDAVASGAEPFLLVGAIAGGLGGGGISDDACGFHFFGSLLAATVDIFVGH